MSEQRNIAERLLKIADACRRDDGTYIPLGEQLQEAADEIASLRAQLAEAEADVAKANDNAVKAWEEREHYREYSANLDRAAHELKAQLASARKALEPFAEIAKEFTPQLSDSHKNTMHWAVPTVGDFRRALSALTDENQNS